MRIFAVLLVLCIFLPVCIAADDSYKPYLHQASVPQSPKLTIYGQYQTSLYPGSATYSYPIAVPKGINGLAPSVSLSYNSQAYRTRSVVGAGWLLSKNYIYHDTNGTLDDTSNDVYVLVLDGNSYNLVYSNGYYVTQVNYYFKITWNQAANYWTVIKPDGTQYRFGYTGNSLVMSNSGRSYAVTWNLDTETDTHGNTISYSYLQNPNPEDIGTSYLASITYGINEISFSYESSPRPDRRQVYEYGNLIDESRRLTDISVFTNSNLVSRNHISYVNLSASLSSINSISYYGSDGLTQLYNVSFSYYSSQPGYYKTSSYIPPTLFSDNNHNDFGVRIIDVNNDGFMDILQSNGTNQNVWLNDKNANFIQSNLFSIPENFTVSNVDQGVRFADVNQDGLPDLLVSRNGYRRVYLNNGTAWNYAPSWTIPVDFVDASGDDLGVQIVDVNGDGKMDIIQGFNGTRAVYLNTGSGWVLSPSWTVPVDFIDGSYRDTGARLVDVNGDGLPDILQGSNPGSISSAWLNTGSGWVNASSTWAPPVYFTTSSYTDNGVRFDDVNGDGFVDILQNFNGTSYAWLNNGTGWQSAPQWSSPEPFTSNGYNIGRRLADVNGDGFSDIVVSQQNSTYQYTWIRNSTVPYLLQSITNAYGGTTLINYTTSTQYNNTVNGISQIGFNIFVVSNILNNNSMNNGFSAIGLTNYTYAFGKYNYIAQEFRGFGLTTESTPYATTNHYFYQDDPRKGREQETDIYSPNGSIYSSNMKNYNWTLDSNNIYNVSLLYSSDYLYDGASVPMVHNITYAYSHFGLPGQVIDWGDGSAAGDEKIYNYSYTFNFNSWIVNKVSDESVFDVNGNKVKETKYYYDNQGLNGVGNTGDLTETEQWNSNGKNVFTYYTYDPYGNMISSTDPLMHVTKYSYDPTHEYLSSEINALGQVTTYSYDPTTGNLLWSSTNGIKTSYLYDIFGRITEEIQPYDSTVMPTKKYYYGQYGTVPVTITTKSRTTSNNTDDVTYFYDGSGNLIQVKTSADNNQDIVKNIFYDGFGNVVSEQNPYFDNHSTILSSISTSANMTFYSYDPLNRVNFILNPDGTNKTVFFNRYNITDYDENGHEHKYELDAYGDITKVHEYNNVPILDEYITSYKYDTNGNLIQITDDKGNVFSFTYDSLDRKTAMSDPDLGNWTYAYDLAGNLVSQTDARQITTTLVYDAINRIVSKLSNSINISFNYDQQFYGTLSNITMSDNRSFVYSYDNRMRIISETQDINKLSFALSYIYDSQNNLLSESSIDSLSYIYGRNGQVDSIPGYINSTYYNAYAVISNRTYANNLVQSYSYNSQNARLININIPSVQNMTYSYDNVGNILSINDQIQKRLSTMQYDALDRLFSANVGMDQYRYVYNPIGNLRKIVKNNQTTQFSFNGAQAHAPSMVTDSLPNSVDLYEPHDLNTHSLNRTTEFVLSNNNNASFTNVGLNLNFANQIANATLNISANQSIFMYVQNNYSNGGLYYVNVTSNNTDNLGYNVKFGTYAESLNLLNTNISIATFELLVASSINETVRNIIWNCSNGINSFYATNLSNMQSFFNEIQYNYSTSGLETFQCNISSLDGNDSISISFTINTLNIENYNVMYQNLSRRVVSFDLDNPFYAINNFNLTINTTNITTVQPLNISSGSTVFGFVEANYSDDILYSLGINASASGSTYSSYNDYFTFDGVDILNYQRFDSNTTSKVLTFDVVNNWYPQNVTWTLNNPSINSTLYLNTSQQLFVFVQNNYTTQGMTNINAVANLSLFSSNFLDLFNNKPLELNRFDSIGTNVFEMYALNHLTQPQMMSWSIDNITSLNTTNLSNQVFIYVQTNYTSGISTPTAKINSSSYNDSVQQVIVI